MAAPGALRASLHSCPQPPPSPLNGAAKGLFCGINCDRRYGGHGASIILAATLRGRSPSCTNEACCKRSHSGRLSQRCRPRVLLAQVALSGKVTSAEEGAMEGVLVSAKKEGGTITITVVSDASGQFSFPASKLGAGKYAISIRAIGYDLQGPQSIELAADKPARPPTSSWPRPRMSAGRLSNGEWIMSVPGSRAAEAVAARLRELPHARADHEVDLRRGRVRDADPSAHGQLREPEHPAASADAASPRGCWRSAATHSRRPASGRPSS